MAYKNDGREIAFVVKYIHIDDMEKDFVDDVANVIQTSMDYAELSYDQKSNSPMLHGIMKAAGHRVAYNGKNDFGQYLFIWFCVIFLVIRPQVHGTDILCLRLLQSKTRNFKVTSEQKKVGKCERKN